MSDALKDVGIAVFGLAFLTGLLSNRMENAVAHGVAGSIKGRVRVTVEPDGPFGAFLGQGRWARVEGRGVAVSDLPFRITPGGGTRAHVRRLEIRLADATIRDIPVRRFHATVPDVSLDAWDALLDQRLVVRRAGQGTVEAVIDAAGMAAFVARAYPDVQGFRLTLGEGIVRVSGRMPVVGVPLAFDATARLAVTGPRYVELADVVMRVNGRDASPALTAAVLRGLNPVLDVEKHFGLGGYISLTSVEVHPDAVTVHGAATIPAAVRER